MGRWDGRKAAEIAWEEAGTEEIEGDDPVDGRTGGGRAGAAHGRMGCGRSFM